jgi:hypothetical protein
MYVWVSAFQISFSLNSTGMYFWTVILHNEDNFYPWFGNMFGSTFVMTPMGSENSRVMAGYELTRNVSNWLGSKTVA